MKECNCTSYYYKTLILGLFNSNPGIVCPTYCAEVGSITQLPNVDECPSLLAFVSNAPAGGYGGFENLSGVWTSIFTVTGIRYAGIDVEVINGNLLPTYQVGINGRWFTADQAFTGINFIDEFHEPLPLPVTFSYRNISSGCELNGQVLG